MNSPLYPHPDFTAAQNTERRQFLIARASPTPIIPLPICNGLMILGVFTKGHCAFALGPYLILTGFFGMAVNMVRRLNTTLVERYTDMDRVTYMRSWAIAYFTFLGRVVSAVQVVNLLYGVVYVLARAPYLTLDVSHLGSPDYCDKAAFLCAATFFGAMGTLLFLGGAALLCVVISQDKGLGKKD